MWIPNVAVSFQIMFFLRARWKTKTSSASSNKVVDKCCVSPDQPFVDANVTAMICLGSPIAHRKHPTVTEFLTNESLLTGVVPAVNHLFGIEKNPSLILHVMGGNG